MHFMKRDIYCLGKYNNQRVKRAVLYYIDNTVCCLPPVSCCNLISKGIRVLIKNTPTVMVRFVAKFANIVVVSSSIISQYSFFAKTIK